MIWLLTTINLITGAYVVFLFYRVLSLTYALKITLQNLGESLKREEKLRQALKEYEHEKLP
jgi:hypothetical protein